MDRSFLSLGLGLRAAYDDEYDDEDELEEELEEDREEFCLGFL